MFDVLTYQKGGALLRMLQQYLGTERFRNGVRHYLGKHAYGNTETSDLWDAIEHSTGEPVRRLMDSWIWQPGFPLVSASIDGSVLTLHQDRFGYTPAATEDPTLWLVPVHVRTINSSGEQQHIVLLQDRTLTLDLSDPSTTVVVNAGGHGFFRVSYDDALRSRIDHDILSRLETIDRFNLVADAWAAVIAGRLSTPEFLAFVEQFGSEQDLAVWQAIDAGLRGCDRLITDAARPHFAARVAALVGPAVAAGQGRIDVWRERLAPERLARADAASGRAVWEKQCAACHRLHGEGGTLGPDLTGSGRHDVDWLLTNVVTPSATVSPDYRMKQLVLADGRVLSGIVARRTPDVVVLRTPTGEETVPVSDVEDTIDGGVSLMPEGILERLDEGAAADLIRFLMKP